MNIVKAVSVIIGTIIGAGFASGKEIYIFFGQYGKFGIIGAIVSATLTGVIIYSTIAITKRLQIKSNNEFLEKISNSSKVKIILENVINAFLLVSFWIMCAGFCTFFKQEFKIPIIITASINAIITYFLLMKNMDGIIKLNLIVVPIMVVIIIAISIKNYPIINLINNLNTNTQKLGKSILSAILYTSYNSITLIPIIVLLATNIKNKIGVGSNIFRINYSNISNVNSISCKYFKGRNTSTYNIRRVPSNRKNDIFGCNNNCNFNICNFIWLWSS